MTTATSDLEMLTPSDAASIRQQIDAAIEGTITSLPNPAHLSAQRRRSIIARYTAVLEGNFIYWMTGTYMAVRSDEARDIILENLHEEVRDSHPRMMRNFAVAARAFPTDTDALAVDPELTNMRLFIGRLAGVPLIVTMAFFEGFIQKFMGFLATLAAGQGSTELEYTDVHGVCDITHTEELFRALAMETALDPPEAGTDLFEGVKLLKALIRKMLDGPSQD